MFQVRVAGNKQEVCAPLRNEGSGADHMLQPIMTTLTCIDTCATKPFLCDNSIHVTLVAANFLKQVAVLTCLPNSLLGTFFSAHVCVGTPAQCFDAVADTGSDNVIVPSCICDEVPGTGCGKHERCFRGSNRSSTFSIPPTPKIAELTFGSGTIQAAIASDVVSVSGVSANMTNGVLLMLNRAALEVSGDFQGILGLGLPKTPAALNMGGTILATEPTPVYSGIVAAFVCLLFPQLCPATVPYHVKRQSTPYEEKLFLQMAKVDRFSLCFQDAEQPGALRFNLPPFLNAIDQIGELHWGIGLQGMSIGPRNGPSDSGVIFCSPETMTPGMTSPCGIIPDSGTTLITGPAQQVKALQAELCSKWPRCREQARGQPSALDFEQVLQDCSSWLNESGLEEIPSLFFHVGMTGKQVEVFELTSWAWVTETLVDGTAVCMPGFGEMEYSTAKNGPVWILGTPLFYEYNVGFDLKAKQVSLEAGTCQPCLSDTLLLSKPTSRLLPRRQQGPSRIRHLDVNSPL